ncbi:hypothetical protein [Psychrobacillus sp. L3]|uniref:hypothetical protein n=1 Tax=Psychrobacillus sp. L3 TaxID=3236891 RepID=UPI0036F3F7D8
MITITLNDDYNAMMREYAKNMKRISEAFGEQFRQIREAQNTIKTAISRIEFPKIDLPEIEIDYKKIEALVEHNSLSGWTITGKMNLNFYLDVKLLQIKSMQLDELFLNYYESNSNETYFMEKSVILKGIDDRWRNVLIDCFDLYESEKYGVIIPLLITIIEGEISDIAMSNEIGNRLIREWKGKILSEEEKFLIIISHSLIKYLSSKMFVRKDFAEERGSMLNRNWVLHGRDNPNYWTKVDALKLINVLSTLQFIKDK